MLGNSTVFRREQYSKTPEPTVIMPSGIVILVNEQQREKRYEQRAVLPLGNENCEATIYPMEGYWVNIHTVFKPHGKVRYRPPFPYAHSSRAAW